MSTVIEIMTSAIELPLWLFAALLLIGAVVGMLVLTLILIILSRGDKDTETVTVSGIQEREHAPQSVSQPVVTTVPVAQPSKSATPFKQLHWYYINGTDKRFASLREALTAIGETVPKHRDWSRLPATVRSRITRVPLDSDPVTTDATPVADATPVVKSTTGADAKHVIQRQRSSGVTITVTK